MIQFVTDRPGHDFRYAVDASKIKSELNWTPSVSFEEGISQTIKWYLNNRLWWEELVTSENLKNDNPFSGSNNTGLS